MTADDSRRHVLVVADERDAAAVALVERLGGAGRLVVPADLSRPGWTYGSDVRLRAGTTAEGRFRVDDLAAVVTRIAAVVPDQLPHVALADRAYVAAEMTAFLRAWLDGLPCPVLNPPTSLSLSGPAWTLEEWAMVAARVGVPFAPTLRAVRRNVVRAAAEAGSWRAVVVGATVFGAGDEAAHARALADAAGVGLLTVAFENGDVVDVNCWPDLADESVADALLAEIAEPARVA
jgi:hypothetical protein